MIFIKWHPAKFVFVFSSHFSFRPSNEEKEEPQRHQDEAKLPSSNGLPPSAQDHANNFNNNCNSCSDKVCYFGEIGFRVERKLKREKADAKKGPKVKKFLFAARGKSRGSGLVFFLKFPFLRLMAAGVFVGPFWSWQLREECAGKKGDKETITDRMKRRTVKTFGGGTGRQVARIRQNSKERPSVGLEAIFSHFF